MKRRNAILFFLFLPAIADIPLSAHSQNVEAVPPNPFGTRSVVNQDAVRDGLTPPSVDAVLDKEVILGSLNGIAIWPNPDAFHAGADAAVPGVSDRGAHIPAETLVELKAKYLGKPLTFGAIGGIEETLHLGLLHKTDRLIGVVVPEQNLTPGVLHVIVTDAVLGEIRIEGNEHFADNRYLRHLRPHSGDTISRTVFAEDLAWISRHPHRDVAGVYQPGAAHGTTDFVLRVEDERPWNVFFNFDNHGVELLGEERIGAGFLFGDLFGTDSVLLYQYLTDTELDRYHAHFAQLRLPLPSRHELRLSGYLADSEAATDFGGEPLIQDGRSWLAAAGYAVILPRWGSIDHEISAGFEAKSAESNLEFGQFGAFGSATEIYQFRLDYRAEDEWRSLGSWASLKNAGSLAALYSPGDWSAGNSAEAFQTVRAEAEAGYWVGQASLESAITAFGLLRLDTRLRGQVADGNLLPSEQLSLSGPDGVRGFEPYVVLADRGLVLSSELSLGTLSLGTALKHREVLRDTHLPFAFIDYGFGGSISALPGEEARSLAAAGIGWRFLVNEVFSGTATYGWQIHESGFEDEDEGRFQIGASVRW